MSYDCVCDYDPPEIYTASTPTARKHHVCEECGCPIAPGERYEYVFGKWDGTVLTFKTCDRCLDIRQWVKNNVPCFCWTHGNMINDAKEAVVEAQYRAKDETAGLYFGFLRRIVLRNRHNTLISGQRD